MTRFECPKCDGWLEGPENRMHSCKGMAGLSMYFVPVGQSVKIEAIEREDYIGQETVQLDGNGRPVMAIITTRDDGQDAIVFAPVARASGEAT